MDAKGPLALFLIFVVSQVTNGDSAPGINYENSNELSRSANFRPYLFHVLQVKILKSMPTVDLSDCANFCLATKKCISFNIQAEPNRSRLYHCELLDKDMFYTPAKFRQSGSFHHYFIQNPCTPDKNPCKNGAKCLPNYQTNRYKCKCTKPYVGRKCAIIPEHCKRARRNGYKTNGVYTIDPDGLGTFDVFCDQTTAEGGWTVFQKRLDGSVDFYRGWTDYKQGFGNLNCEFWLGLDKIHRLTSQTNNTLRVELEDFDGNTSYAEFDMFAVANETAKYKLSVGSFSGTAGDSLSANHHGMMFTTKDQDNDKFSSKNCAVSHKGAWWYKTCHTSNLNGLYRHKQTWISDGITWDTWKMNYYSAKRAEMKIRPIDL